jgi:16S rRNA (cytosine967-C5)-methyltransferase
MVRDDAAGALPHAVKGTVAPENEASLPPSARSIALAVLRAVETRGAYSNRALSDQLERHPGLDTRDRGLCTTLVYGVLRHRARLDHLIDTVADRPRKLGGQLRELLRIAAFELRELERPAPVAISEAVRLARPMDATGGLDAVVHAVLGRIDREGPALDQASMRASALDALEHRWSIPRWLGGRWLKRLGAERALARARALSRPPPIDVRIDATRTDPAEVRARLTRDHPNIEIELVPGQPQALRLRRGGDLFFGPLHDEGLISVQGLAAQQPARLLQPRAGEHVLDACAGMGTKTLQLAELMGRKGRLVAADSDARRLSELARLRRRGRLDAADLSLTVVEANLATAPIDGLDDGVGFDAVLVDAPCTGLGNLARHPEIRWRSRFDDIAACAEIQRVLLDRCLDRVRPGGRLVYAACSLEPEEGEDLVGRIVRERGATLHEQRSLTPEGGYGEGFYLALLVPGDGPNTAVRNASRPAS